MRICFSPEERRFSGSEVPLRMVTPILPVSDTSMFLSMKMSLTMSL